MAIFHSIKNYLANHKAKATARDNLPAALVKQVLSDYGPLLSEDERNDDYARVNKEANFRELHIARIIFEAAGLLRLTKGHFVLTKKSLSNSDSDLFKLLFITYVKEYNWGYEDSYPDEDFFQTATWFSLVMLNRLSGTSINKTEFAEDFLRIFPSVLNEFKDSPYQSSLKAATNAYQIRMIERFWRFFGLITLTGERFTPNYNKTMLVMPLLQQVFVFPEQAALND